MTSLLREEIPVPMAESASATTTSCPARTAGRPTASPTTPAPTTSTCIGRRPLELDRQPGVILSQRAHGGLGARHIVELGELAFAIEGIMARVQMEDLCHPPGETLG